MTLYDFHRELFKRYELKNAKELNGKTIFITGANGLVGGNLLAYLLFLDKKYTLKLKLIAHSFSEPIFFNKYKNVKYLNGDLRDLDLNFNFDFCFHCATYAQPFKVLEHMRDTVYLNTVILFNLIEKCIKNNSKLIFLSSSATYGEPIWQNGGGGGIDKNELSESDMQYGFIDLQSKASIYAQSKRMAESILFNSNCSFKIVRLAISYGAGVKLDDRRVINEFIKKAVFSRELSLLDSGLAKRRFLYITDCIFMLLNIAINSKENLYNISNDEDISILELARVICEITKAELLLTQTDKSISGTQTSTQISSRKYFKEFNCFDKIPLKEGLKFNIKWLELLKNMSKF
ncbi:NAD-dependent epimerase/dehydratase family protein [Helicobacter pullorum]|uniref:NAD-dependent epimerase/dehydratase family protein n=1 Tax=Helicobacter pullorum TaxID=35818 RepID=UPI00320978A7